MTGHYPSTDFEIVDEGNIRKVRHLPTVMLIETGRLRGPQSRQKPARWR